ncbi:uncharacterized protein LOC135366118 [Ornithodoros turicata]|uniref:uncharacterized protein LOC135366118 n=1 Tax=Ornithodoros turicata TaxID=34597 RepID=UPI0031388E66
MLLKVLLICVWVVVHGQGLDSNKADFTELQADLQADIDQIIKPEILPNQRYSVSYDTTDEHDTRIFHTEIIDPSNARLGTYGYINGEGLFRIVYYIADSTGYHVFVCTNEPGTETSDPADAQIRVHKQWKLATSAKVNMLFTRVKAAPEIVKKHMAGERMDDGDMIKKVVFEMMPSDVTSEGVSSRDRIVPDQKGFSTPRTRRQRRRKQHFQQDLY